MQPEIPLSLEFPFSGFLFRCLVFIFEIPVYGAHGFMRTGPRVLPAKELHTVCH